MCPLCKHGELFDDSHCLSTALTRLVGWLFQLLWNAKHKKVEVTLLTLWDVRLTSSYETLQTNAFATSLPTLQKQPRWRFGVFSCFSAHIPTSASPTLRVTSPCSFLITGKLVCSGVSSEFLSWKLPARFLFLCFVVDPLASWKYNLTSQSFVEEGAEAKCKAWLCREKKKKVTNRNIL